RRARPRGYCRFASRRMQLGWRRAKRGLRMDDDLRGVKGWLLTFVIIIALVSPGLSALETWRELHSGATAEFSNIPIFASIRILAWGTVAFAALVGWFVAWRLVAIHNWTSVRLAIGGIWLGSLGTNVIF